MYCGVPKKRAAASARRPKASSPKALGTRGTKPEFGRFSATPPRAYRLAMAVTLALAGDTMLGRGVAERLAGDPGVPLLAGELEEIASAADLFVLNLECCVSERGARVRDPGKRFFFRAPPAAAERLAEMGVGCATLANNHVLDFGAGALEDTLAHLGSAGIAAVGAGPEGAAARMPAGP